MKIFFLENYLLYGIYKQLIHRRTAPLKVSVIAIFIILIVSCISTLVAPSNLSIIASIGMEVYNTPLQFHK